MFCLFKNLIDFLPQYYFKLFVQNHEDLLFVLGCFVNTVSALRRCALEAKEPMTTKSAGNAWDLRTAMTGCTSASWPCCPWFYTGSLLNGIQEKRGLCAPSSDKLFKNGDLVSTSDQCKMLN